jgi:hypothetical protein
VCFHVQRAGYPPEGARRQDPQLGRHRVLTTIGTEVVLFVIGEVEELTCRRRRGAVVRPREEFERWRTRWSTPAA